MLTATTIARMSRNRSSALARTRAIAAHMSTGATSPLDQVLVLSVPATFNPTHPSQPVLFQSNGCARSYVLNRAKKLNALNSEMINSLRPQLNVSWRLTLFLSFVADQSV